MTRDARDVALALATARLVLAFAHGRPAGTLLPDLERAVLDVQPENLAGPGPSSRVTVTDGPPRLVVNGVALGQGDRDAIYTALATGKAVEVRV